MGYTLAIGEKEIDNSDPEYHFTRVKNERHDQAPAFGEPTDHENARWPSYSGWSDCMTEAGMFDLFFDKDNGLLNEHPGYKTITPALVDTFRARKKAFEEKYPSVTAEYLDDGHDGFITPNATYCRIVWLDYWLTWALAHCKEPIFFNS